MKDPQSSKIRPFRHAFFSNLGIRKLPTVSEMRNYFLHLIFRYLNSARDFLPIDINFNVKIKGYGVPYNYHFGKSMLHNTL